MNKEIKIGEKIKRLRIRNGLTQEELANRSELSKGFISQLESDQTSPSIATLMDILECLGTNLKDFFNEAVEEKIVFSKNDIFVKENRDLKHIIQWIIPNSQKNSMEPILMTLEPDGSSEIENPHQGEEFGYILTGCVDIHIGEMKFRAKKGESFYFRPSASHYITNAGTSTARFIWVVTPPNF